MAYGSSVFKVDSRPDGGEFGDGCGAALAWDILRQVGRHQIPTTIDLSGVQHLKPYSLACLCALGKLGKLNGRPIEIVKPRDRECAEHLSRLGVPLFFDCDWAESGQRDSNLSIRSVSWPPGNDAGEIVEFLAPRADLSPGVFPSMVENLDEVLLNALTHAVSPIDCLVAGQAFPRTSKVEIAVVDLGQTIRGHLTKNPDHADINSDQDAISKALEDEVTGTPRGQKNRRGEENSGSGLTELRRYCESGGGELTVLSGEHWITCRTDQEPVIGTLHGGFRGCMVNIRYFTRNNLNPEQKEAIL